MRTKTNDKNDLTLFVAGFPWATHESELTELFAPCDQIASVRIVLNHQDGRSRGFNIALSRWILICTGHHPRQNDAPGSKGSHRQCHNPALQTRYRSCRRSYL